MASAFATDGPLQRKMPGGSVARAGKGINLVISNEDIDDIIGILKSLENSFVLIGEVSEISKLEVKRQKSRFIGILLDAMGALMLENMFTGKVVMIEGR